MNENTNGLIRQYFYEERNKNAPQPKSVGAAAIRRVPFVIKRIKQAA